MYISDVRMAVDSEVVERYKGGFVGIFTDHQTCITWPYSCLLYRKVNTNDTAVLFIRISDIYDYPDNSSAMATSDIRWPFDIAEYQKESYEKKKRRILEEVNEACLWVAKYHGWPQEPFISAHDWLIEHNFQYTFYSRNQWTSPKKQWKARITAEFEMEHVTISLALTPYRTKNEFIRVPVENKPCRQGGFPVDAGIENKFSNLGWISDTEFQIKTSRREYIIDTTTMTTSSVKIPAWYEK